MIPIQAVAAPPGAAISPQALQMDKFMSVLPLGLAAVGLYLMIEGSGATKIVGAAAMVPLVLSMGGIFAL